MDQGMYAGIDMEELIAALSGGVLSGPTKGVPMPTIEEIEEGMRRGVAGGREGGPAPMERSYGTASMRPSGMGMAPNMSSSYQQQKKGMGIEDLMKMIQAMRGR